MAATGRRERKKQRTREAIVGAAFELFAERGFDGVTASEIAARADVARATLFSHFPTKEAIVLDQVGDDDPATIVRERAAGEAPLAALREHYRAFARATAENRVSAETAAMLRTRLRVITGSQTLLDGVRRLGDAQQAALAAALADGEADLDAELAAAQVCAALAVLKMRFFAALAAGAPEPAARLPEEVEAAFDLLEGGLGRWS